MAKTHDLHLFKSINGLNGLNQLNELNELNQLNGLNQLHTTNKFIQWGGCFVGFEQEPT